MKSKKTYKVNQSGLVADKELFRIWFEFYKLALVSYDKEVQSALRKSKKIYADWEINSNEYFDDWWISHNHLFIDIDNVRLMAIDELKDDEYLYVVVPRTRSINVAVDEFTELLSKEFNVTRSKKTHVPKHRFAPTEIQGFKREVIRLTLDLMKNVFIDETLKGKNLYEKVQSYLETSRFKKQKNEMPNIFEDLKNGSEDAKRNIRRYRTRGMKILLNVANGRFPGTY